MALVSRVPRQAMIHGSCRVDSASSCRLELPTRDVRSAVKLEAGLSGRDQVVLIASVEEGSEAWRAGVRPGQRLAGISDPNISGQVWELGGNSSFRFVKDAMRMRMASTITLDIDADIASTTAGQSAEPAPSSASASSAATGAMSPATGSAVSQSVDALDAMLSCDDDAAAAPSSSDTIGEKLARDQRCRITIAPARVINICCARRRVHDLVQVDNYRLQRSKITCITLKAHIVKLHSLICNAL